MEIQNETPFPILRYKKKRQYNSVFAFCTRYIFSDKIGGIWFQKINWIFFSFDRRINGKINRKTLSMCVAIRIFFFYSKKLTYLKTLVTIENWCSLLFMVWENIFTLKRNFISEILNFGGEYIRIITFLKVIKIICDEKLKFARHGFWKAKILRCIKIDKLTSIRRVIKIVNANYSEIQKYCSPSWQGWW